MSSMSWWKCDSDVRITEAGSRDIAVLTQSHSRTRWSDASTPVTEWRMWMEEQAMTLPAHWQHKLNTVNKLITFNFSSHYYTFWDFYTS